MHMQTFNANVPMKISACPNMLRQFTLFCRPIYGLIFLFKWQKEQDTRPVMSDDEHAGRLFFARQVVTNACATQALLSILLNRQDLVLGPELNSLKEFTADFDPEMRGNALIPYGTTMHLLCDTWPLENCECLLSDLKAADMHIHTGLSI